MDKQKQGCEEFLERARSKSKRVMCFQLLYTPCSCSSTCFLFSPSRRTVARLGHIEMLDVSYCVRHLCTHPLYLGGQSHREALVSV